MRTPTLIETVRIKDGGAPHWALHLRRLSESCRDLGVPLPGTLLLPEGGPDRVHRLEVGPKGVKTEDRPVGSTKPVRLVTARTPHQPYPHKTTDRAVFDRARAEAAAGGADDALLVTKGGGFVAECSIWAIFWWEEGLLCAPAPELGILRSVARMRLEEVIGKPAVRQVRVEGLAHRSIFVANSARGVVPVASLDGHVVPEAAETEELARRFWP
jgi:branched-chain amino acid aminotransferase